MTIEELRQRVGRGASAAEFLIIIPPCCWAIMETPRTQASHPLDSKRLVDYLALSGDEVSLEISSSMSLL